MSVDEIGSELLPNVYISNIFVDDQGVQVEFVVIDFVDNPTWAGSQILKNEMLLRTLIIGHNVEDSDVIDIVSNLNEGLESINLLSNKPYKMVVNNMRIIDNHHNVIQNGAFNYYYYILNARVPDILFKENIYIYSMLSIDMRSKNLDYTDYKFLDGPMTSEIIKLNGEVPNRTTVYRRSDGSLYSGPIHVHAETNAIMEGSFHSENPHEVLQEIKVTNTKNLSIDN